eukprot:scaffold8333_cov90-Cyclotella_meneghiniana.AAC.1
MATGMFGAEYHRLEYLTVFTDGMWGSTSITGIVAIHANYSIFNCVEVDMTRWCMLSWSVLMLRTGEK